MRHTVDGIIIEVPPTRDWPLLARINETLMDREIKNKRKVKFKLLIETNLKRNSKQMMLGRNFNIQNESLADSLN